jgi:hypothetical protein
MNKVVNLFTPISAEITPDGGTLSAGDFVTIDTNVPAVVLYTIDGSEPKVGGMGTFRGDAPVQFELRVSARVRFKAIDSRLGRSTNQTKTQEASFTIERNNPVEEFRDTAHFFRRLVKSIVDQNFYLTEGKWLVPTSSRAYTYAFVNREGFPVRLRVLHNGIDIFTQFPIVGANQLKEVPIRPMSGENVLEIQTQRAGSTALYDIGLYDIDTYAP